MGNVADVTIPEYLVKKIRELSQSEGISVEQFVNSAVAEKASAWITIDYLKERGKRGDRRKYDEILKKVPDAEPAEDDRLP